MAEDGNEVATEDARVPGATGDAERVKPLEDHDDGTPARRVRARYLDTYTWRNPATNASLKWSVPRDEIRVLPARLN